MDRHRVQVLDVLLLLEEELDKLGRLFRVLRILEDHPGLSIDLGSRLLPGWPMRLHHHPEVLGIACPLGRVLLDVARAPAIALVEHGGLASGQVGEGVQIAMAQPARRQDRGVEFLVEIEHLDDLLLGEGGPAGLEVEEPAAVGLGQFSHRNIDEERLRREGEAVAGYPAVLVPLHHGFGHFDEVIPGLWRLQPLRPEDVLPVDQER